MAESKLSTTRDASLLSDDELAAISGGGFEEDVAAIARRMVVASFAAAGVDVSDDLAARPAAMPGGS